MFDSTPDPADGQTLLEIEKYLRACVLGSEVAIRNTQYGIRVYKLAKVIEITAKGFRIRTDISGHQGGDLWNVKSGKSFKHPTGQSRLFIPSDAIRRDANGTPEGVLTNAIYHPR